MHCYELVGGLILTKSNPNSLVGMLILNNIKI
jgi:hypothetical protein